MKTQQYVILPRKESGPQLQGYEILVYVTIRRYMNKDNMQAWPSIETIKKLTSLSKATISKMIKSIEEKGYFKISKRRIEKSTYNVYTFNNTKSFEPFSYDFLDKEDLTKQEKLNILCTQQYMYKNNGIGKISLSDKDLCEATGMDRRMLKHTRKSLIDKGYCSQVTLKLRDPETGVFKQETIYHLDELGQAIVFTLSNVAQQTEKNTEDIKILQRENAELKKQIQKLTQSAAVIL